MYLVTIGKVYVKAGSPTTAMRRVVRSIENRRFLTAHQHTTIEAIGVDEPMMHAESKIGQVLPKPKPKRDQEGHFVAEGQRDER